MINTGPQTSGSRGDTERRKTRRFTLEQARVVVYPEGLLVKFGIGRDNRALTAIDLSEGGAQIVLSDPMAPGTKVHIKLRPNKFLADEIQAMGEIRWCFEDAQSGRSRAGVMFLEIGAQDLEKISDLRQKLGKEL